MTETQGSAIPKYAMAIAKTFTASECFEFRLERKEELHKYRAMVKDLKATTNMRHLDCQKEAKRHFGYTSKDEEIRLYAEHIATRSRLASQENTNQKRRDAYAKKRNKTFEEIVAKLPPNADPILELNWIKSHPAMTRKSRQKNNDKIVIDEDDIFNSASGPAPSRSAAQQLVFWCNSPDKFFAENLSEAKKAKAKTEEEAAKQRSVKTNAEIDLMLGTLFPENLDG
tara:strand:- start:85 stop:765 length:681 start_codon:yes stop_codon:yes gene_type:complete